MPSFLSSSAFAVASFAALTQALPQFSGGGFDVPVGQDPDAPTWDNGLPQITPVFAGSGDCEGFGYGNFSLRISHCTNSTTDEPCDIEGFANNVQILPQADSDSNEGILSFPTTENENPQNKFSCYVGSRSVQVVQIEAPTDGGDLTSTTVGVSNITDTNETIKWSNSMISYGDIEPYNHYTYDGDRFWGVYVGNDKQTSWAIKYQDALTGSPDGLPYYSIRLLSQGEELREGESATWLKIGGSL